MAKVTRILRNNAAHWVGDGFPVRTLFSYDREGQEISPFLLFDYAAPHNFAPAATPRGVGQHPHRGFETVTIAYQGEVAHRDSAGNAGVIGAGDVQWMTAASGIIHEEFHSPAFTMCGGPFQMVQLWVNLPATDKVRAPQYQAITRDQIAKVALPGGGGAARVIAGDFAGTSGPAHTHTPINLWDVRMTGEAPVALTLPVGHSAMIAVLDGRVTSDGGFEAGAAEIMLFDRSGGTVTVSSNGPATILVMTGEPIDEPIVGHGPFVMNSEAEIRNAYADFRAGRFGVVDA
ncbi:MAG: pirin family protein [Pseudomonadota bacterium]